MPRKKKEAPGPDLPFYYGSTTCKQYELFSALKAIKNRTVVQGDLDVIKRHLFKKIKIFDASEKADIVMTFVSAVMTTRTFINPRFTYRFVDQRLKNAIRTVRRTRKYILSDKTEEVPDDDDPFSAENNIDF